LLSYSEDHTIKKLDLLLAYAYNIGMSRPKKDRCINCLPSSPCFKPRGIPLYQLKEVILNLDELEAIRLADYEGLYHEKAAEKMNISRPTFGRIINNARSKIADAIINGKALQIETLNKKRRLSNENMFRS
jgi:predicted DNA-binding protein (UPF0251 family)